MMLARTEDMPRGGYDKGASEKCTGYSIYVTEASLGMPSDLNCLFIYIKSRESDLIPFSYQNATL